MKVLRLSEDEAKNLDQLPLRKIWDELEKIKPLERLPIVGPDDVIGALAHRSLITGFGSRHQDTLPNALGEMAISALNADEKALLLKTFAFVPVNATLGEARTAMRVVSRCHDVIVTQTGSKTEPVLGWLTDSDLATLPD